MVGRYTSGLLEKCKLGILLRHIFTIARSENGQLITHLLFHFTILQNCWTALLGGFYYLKYFNRYRVLTEFRHG